MKIPILALFLSLSVSGMGQNAVAAFVNPGSGWVAKTTTGSSGGTTIAPPAAYLFVQDDTSKLWVPWDGSGTGGTYVGVSPIVVSGFNISCPTCGTSLATVQSFAAPAGSWPAWLVPTVTNSTTTPSLAVAVPSQTQGKVLASPSGSSGTMAPRVLVAGDIPSLPYLPNTTVLPATNAGAAHNFFNTYDSVTGLLSIGQPGFTDLIGNLGVSQGPTGISGIPKLSSGVWSAAVAGTDFLAPNGSAAALSKASNSAFGVSECDNSTITCAGGIFTSVGGGGASAVKTYAFFGCYGDSFMFASSAPTPSADGICGLMAAEMPGIYSYNSHNYGISSQTTQTTTNTFWSNFAAFPQRPSFTLGQSGNNDGGVQGNSANALKFAQENWQAAIAFATLPLQARIMASNCSPSGPWSGDFTLGINATPNGVTSMGTPMSTTASGASETCTIPSSTSTWLGITYEVATSRGGTFTVNIDGTNVTSANTGTTTFSSNPPGNVTSGGAGVTAVEEFFTVTPGSHTVIFTSSNSNTVTAQSVDWLPSNCSTACGGFQLSGGNAAYTFASDYDTAFASMVTTMRGLGFPVLYASMINGTPGVNATTDIGAASAYCNATGTSNHPNSQCGYAHWAQTIYATEVAANYYWSFAPNPPMTATGGTTVYPGAGIPVSTGSAWGTSLTAPAGTIVGTTDTQTLTNKSLTSPALTGIPIAPTATLGTNTPQIATTAFVLANVGSGGDTITSPGGTLSVGGTSTNTTLDLALGHANTWTAAQALGSSTATTQAQNDNSIKLSTTAYTDLAIANAVAGVNPAVAVLAASTANVAGTYVQVGGGIGDTYTVTATGAFTLDGIAINTIGQRVLLKNQTTASQNGVYTATVVGATAISPVFTRALDYDTPSDVNNTGTIPVQSGTANTTTSWLLTSQVTSIGSSGSAITYVQFSFNPANQVLAISPGVGLAHFAGGTQTATSSLIVAADITAATITGAKLANNTVTATQLAAQYSNGSCMEVWGGSGASFALTSGDDSISNNSCYNDSGVTRTITAVKCLSDNASNTTTVNPTFGASGTGTTILSGALTCGNSNAMSSSGTVSNASWTTGTGVNPAMAGTLTGTHIGMIVEYTF